MHLKKSILLTGNPGVGKTTVIKKVLSGLKNAGGFFTEEIRKRKRGLDLELSLLMGKGEFLHTRKRENI